MNWSRTSSVWIQSDASLVLSSSSIEPVASRRMALASICMLSGLSSASTAVSTHRAMDSVVWAGSKMGSGPVGWISICLSWTAVQAIAGVI
jgi:hypothetical protein